MSRVFRAVSRKNKDTGQNVEECGYMSAPCLGDKQTWAPKEGP